MIYTSNLIMNGNMVNVPNVYTNNLSANGFSNINFMSDINVQGNILGAGRVQTGTTIYGKYVLTSNLSFPTACNEIPAISNFSVDPTATDISGLTVMNMAVPPQDILDNTTGTVTIPVSALYNIYIQGSFSNSQAPGTYVNGVYFRFLDSASSNARVAAIISADSPITYTSYTGFLPAGSRFQPVFYSSDSNVSLVADAGETFIGCSLIMATP